ncbi:hypothetical protein EZV73_23870 [Acidaminobacter sp. JC074]|uniref:hypothetical protein n=1 Tax=Acidaminobacter sp. JC074 TaxID=2530199 RepID=UPI001F0F8EC4|nr:hypothetical protein [Acidaminobacter sp. JC074]MCH4890641.1 hypothetical protein [Acidaminobacter sp. JC074]
MFFKINLVIYPVLIALEALGWFFMIGKLTDQEVNKKRLQIATIAMVVLTMILDIFVFKFYKSNPRSFLLLAMYLVSFKYIFKCSFAKSVVSLTIMFISMMALDMVIILIVNGVFASNIESTMDHYAFFYSLNIGLVHTVNFIVRKFNLRILKVNKLSI